MATIDGELVAVHTSGTDGTGEPITSSTPFLVGSVAKTFTSTAVLRLVADSAIGLNDPVVGHLPWLEAPEVTVRHLLTHTSGYRGRPRRRPWRVVWAVAALAVALGSVALPLWFGMPPRVLWIWMPDVAIGLGVCVVTWLVAALSSVRHVRRRRPQE